MSSPTPLPGPQPGDIFREFTYQHPGLAGDEVPPHFSELDPGAQHPIATTLRQARAPRQPAYISLDDLDGAVRAEMVIEYWGGHIGTQLLGFRINKSDWLPMPAPVGTPQRVEHYYRTFFGNPAVPVPLELLKPGVNAVRFGAGPQIFHSFDCGFFWIYSFSIRVYYNGDKAHPTGRLVIPESGACLSEPPTLAVETHNNARPIVQVDFIGEYEDFDWEGNGLFRQWHYSFHYGVMHFYAAMSRSAPHSVTWDTHWLPDQAAPMRLMARLTDSHGMHTMTPAVEDLTLQREERAVKMYHAHDVPEAFGVRVGQRQSCTIHIPDDVRQVKAARLVLSTWSGAHGDVLALNHTMLVPRVGRVHDYSLDKLDVPPSLLRQGDNVFSVMAETEHHAVEVNWPGPVLLVIY